MTLPESVTVVSVEREGKIVIPKDGTIFMPGDIVTLLGNKKNLNTIKQEFIKQDKNMAP